MRPRRPPRVLIIDENLSVPRDRRVWRQCQALVAFGIGVSVICPRGTGDPAYEELDGVRLHKYPAPPVAAGALGFLVEYAYSFWAAAALLARVWRRDGVGAVQVCNPPDIYFPLGVVVKLLGRPFVFDQHDLAPELYMSRFGRNRGLLLSALRALERATYATADHVIATNETYRDTAMARGGKRADEITVVRNGPDLDAMPRRPPRPDLREGREYLCCYVGVMGPQDGVDYALRAVRSYVRDLGRTDCQFTFIGSGDSLDGLRALAGELGLGPWVTFTGFVPDELVFEYLSTADVGISPDPLNPLNDVSTMNKTMEYMAYGLPVVAFDLRETRVSAADAAVYARPNDEAEIARLLAGLLDDPACRAELGRRGRERVETVLAWQHQRDAYVELYQRLLHLQPAPKR